MMNRQAEKFRKTQEAAITQYHLPRLNQSTKRSMKLVVSEGRLLPTAHRVKFSKNVNTTKYAGLQNKL
jgi:hypothetical protein